MRATFALLLVITLPGVPRLGADSPPMEEFNEPFVPDPSFRFQGTLACEVLVATVRNFVGSRFTLRGADTNVALRSFSADAKGQRFPRIHESPERVVFQLADGDAGSVDTLSVDKTNGTFARTWPGWTLEGRWLGAGGERGRSSIEQGAPSAAPMKGELPPGE